MTARRSRMVVTRASPTPSGAASHSRPVHRLTKLTLKQEQELIENVFDLDRRGFALCVADIEYIANHKRVMTFLVENGEFPEKDMDVGKKWTEKFVDRVPQLKACLERNKAYQQETERGPGNALSWFKLLEEVKAEYNISDTDVFALGEARFPLTPRSAATVTTRTQHATRRTTRSEGNQRWATVLQGLRASGAATPPAVIFTDAQARESWSADDTPPDWVLDSSRDGRSNASTLSDWLSVAMIYSAEQPAPGQWRLLILNCPEAGYAMQWDEHCKSYQILTVYVPPGLSHLLNPLEAGCLAPLDAAYRAHVKQLSRHRAGCMTDSEFLVTLRHSLESALTQETITAAFQLSGIVPFAPEAVVGEPVTLESVVSWAPPRVPSPSPPAEAYEELILCGSEFREMKARILAQEARARKRKNAGAMPKKNSSSRCGVSKR